MHGNRIIHTVDPPYAPPVLRSVSPTHSLSTDYGEDATPYMDLRLSEVDFAQMVEESLGINAPRIDDNSMSILLPKPRSAQEEKQMHEMIMENLRRNVKAIEDEAAFEAMALSKMSPAFAEQPTSDDLDKLMKSMLGPESSANTPTQNGFAPWASRHRPRNRGTQSFLFTANTGAPFNANATK